MMALNSNLDLEIHPLLPPSKVPTEAPGGTDSNEHLPIAGHGAYGIVYKVPVGNGIFAARKIFGRTSHPATMSRACMAEFGLLKRARDENAGNVVQLLPRPAQPTPIIPGQVVEVEGPSKNSEGQMSFDMELSSLGNLREFLHNNPQIEVTEGLVAWVGRQAFAGLAWLHRRHILHADVKPENLLCWGGQHAPYIKLGDLGSAVPLDRNGVDSAGKIHFCLTTQK